MMQVAQCFAARSVLVAALILCGCFVAKAQAAPDAGQQPPATEPAPVADKGTTSQFNCIDQDEKYVGSGKHVFYRLELTNKCEQRLKCAVFAYLVSAKGPSQGHATLVLAAKSKGAAATQVFELKSKSMGGMGTASRECRVY
jgi:hypothetical protein